MKGILGRKIGMSRTFVDGNLVPVTVLEAGPCKVINAKDGKASIAFGKKSAKKVSKAMNTIYTKAGTSACAIVREISGDYKIGDEVTTSIFEGVKYVDVTGTSKGKGFQGVMKRHNFAGGPKSHGATKFHRRPGSIGNFASSGRVFPEKKMPGQMGNERVTTQNLKLVKVEGPALYVKGAIPGARNSFVFIKPALKKEGAK